MKFEDLRKHLEELRPPLHTGVGEHWGREVRSLSGRGVAWCGGVRGLREAQAISVLVNAVPALLDELEQLKTGSHK